MIYILHPSGSGGALRHDDDAVADHAVGGFLGVVDALLVDDADVAADAAVLVDDGAFDVRAFADAQRRIAVGAVRATASGDS